jgi:hypothetical protein
MNLRNPRCLPALIVCTNEHWSPSPTGCQRDHLPQIADALRQQHPAQEPRRPDQVLQIGATLWIDLFAEDVGERRTEGARRSRSWLKTCDS